MPAEAVGQEIHHRAGPEAGERTQPVDGEDAVEAEADGEQGESRPGVELARVDFAHLGRVLAEALMRGN